MECLSNIYKWITLQIFYSIFQFLYKLKYSLKLNGIDIVNGMSGSFDDYILVGVGM